VSLNSDSVGNVTAGTVATLVYPADGARDICFLYNNGSVTAYVGGSGVTAANGYPVAINEKHFWFGAGAIYAITASATADIRYHNVSG
jgi:hypothetical protein